MKTSTLSVLVMLIILSITQTTIAQISGTVKEAQDGTTIVGANIFVMELERGTISNAKGFFELLDLPQSDLTIQVSFIGYQTQYFKWKASSGETQLEINLNQEVIRHEEIVVSAGFSDTQHKNAITVDFIDRENMVSMAAPSVNQLLADLPGVDVASSSGAVSQPVIRGLSGTNILVLNNGIRLENYQFSRNHPFIIDEFGVERIEVIKGPASLLYGSDAVGGVINVIKELPAPNNSMNADFSSRYYSNTNGSNTTLGVRQSGKTFQWGLRGIIRAHHDYKDGNNNTVPNSRYTNKAFKTFAGLNLKKGSTKLYYDYSKDDIGMTVEGLSNSMPNDHARPNIWYQDLNNHFIASKTTLLFGDVKLDGNLGYQINQRKEIEAPDAEDDGVAINSELRTFTYELKAQRPITDEIKSIVGIQGMHRNNSNNEAEGKILPDADLMDFSAFMFLQYSPSEDLNLQGGVRYDYRQLDVPHQERGAHEHGPTIPGDHFTEEEEEEHIELYRTFNNISGSLGATYHLSHSTLLRANVASAFRAPNLAELTQAGFHAGRHEEGNPDLEAQRSVEGDISVHSHYDLFTFDLSAYYNRINNYIFLAPTGEFEDGSPVYEYDQALANLYGAEMGLHLHPKSAEWLHLKATGAWINAKQENGAYLPFIPPFRGKVELMGEKDKIGALGKSFIRFDVEMSADQNNPAEFETRTAGYYLLNASIGSSLRLSNTHMNFSLAVNNLLNRQYVDHLNMLKPLGYYNMGRNVSIGLNINF